MSMRTIFFICLIHGFLGCKDAYASTSPLMLGKSEEFLHRYLDFEAECVDEKTAIAIVKNGKFNSIFFAPVDNGSDVELVFDGCSKESVLVAITFSMGKAKAESLEHLYTDIVGKPVATFRGARKSWSMDQYEVTISHVFDERYALTLRML